MVKQGRVVGGVVAHEAAERKRDAGDDLVAAHEDVTALAQGLNGHAHARGVVTDDADIVRIMADGGGDGAAGDVVATHPAPADVFANEAHAGRTVPVGPGLLGGDGAAVAFEEHEAAQAVGRVWTHHARDGLAGDEVDDRLAGAEVVLKDLVGELGQVDGVVELACKLGDLGRFGRNLALEAAVLGHERACGVYAVRRRGKGEVIEHEHVGALARRDGAAALVRVGAGVVEPEAACGGKRRHGDGDERVDALFDGEAAGVVNHAVLAGVGGRAVVGGKAAAAGAGGVLQNDGDEVLQVVAAGSLANHHVHPVRELLERLFDRGALVVGDDAGCGIGVEVASGKHRSMAIYQPRRGRFGDVDAAERLVVRKGDAGRVHHLA